MTTNTFSTEYGTMNETIRLPTTEITDPNQDDHENRLIVLNYLIGNLKRSDEFLVSELRQAWYDNSSVGKNNNDDQGA